MFWNIQVQRIWVTHSLTRSLTERNSKEYFVSPQNHYLFLPNGKHRCILMYISRNRKTLASYTDWTVKSNWTEKKFPFLKSISLQKRDEKFTIFNEESSHTAWKHNWCNMVAFKVLEHDSSQAAQIYSKIFKELAKEFLMVSDHSQEMKNDWCSSERLQNGKYSTSNLKTVFWKEKACCHFLIHT